MKAEGFLFPSEHGTHLDGTNLRNRVLYRACEAAGLPRAEWPTWHDLRHAFATTYLNKRGDNWKRAMELMGHGDIRTTLLYTHVVHDPARDAKDAVRSGKWRYQRGCFQCGRVQESGLIPR